MMGTTKAIAIVEREGEPKLTISPDDVKRYLCQDASPAEIGLFLKVCSSEGLNPFKRECFLVKYAKDQPAAIIIATEAFVKAAETCPEFDGLEAGIILKDTAGKLEFREGSFILAEEAEKLVGGWAKVYRKDRQRAFYAAVNIQECKKYTKEGNPTRFWREMPATMVRKTALSRALREAFPNRFGGLITTAEYEETPEGKLPRAYERNGEAYWALWWAQQKEKGLSENDVHRILGVTSVKADWVEKGRTLEEADAIINDALEKTAKPKAPNLPEPKASEPSQKPSAEGEGVKPEDVLTITDLYKICNKLWKMQPKEVLKELGYIGLADIAQTPWECFQQIKAARG